MKGSSSSSVRVINELDAFEPNFKTPDSPPNATYRKLWEVKFFDKDLEPPKLLPLNDIAKFGPYVAVASALKTEGIKKAFKTPEYMVSIHPVMEYSLEFPYGRPARVWVNSEVACYRIMSVSSEYAHLWTPFYQMVNFTGHVVNVLLNFTGKFDLVRFIWRVAELSRLPTDECLRLWSEHRRFIQESMKGQSIPSVVRSSYRAMTANPNAFTSSWERKLLEGLKEYEQRDRESSSMPDVSEPSSDDYSFIESKARSAESVGERKSTDSLEERKQAIEKKHVIEKKSAINSTIPFPIIAMEQSAVPVQLERFQWRSEASFKCPQCPLSFPCLFSFKVHLQAHLTQGKELISPFTKSLDERMEAFLQSLSRVKKDRRSVDALRFRKKLLLPPRPTLKLAPIKRLSGERQSDPSSSAGTTQQPAKKKKKKSMVSSAASGSISADASTGSITSTGASVGASSIPAISNTSSNASTSANTSNTSSTANNPPPKLSISPVTLKLTSPKGPSTPTSLSEPKASSQSQSLSPSRPSSPKRINLILPSPKPSSNSHPEIASMEAATKKVKISSPQNNLPPLLMTSSSSSSSSSSSPSPGKLPGIKTCEDDAPVLLPLKRSKSAPVMTMTIDLTDDGLDSPVVDEKEPIDACGDVERKIDPLRKVVSSSSASSGSTGGGSNVKGNVASNPVGNTAPIAPMSQSVKKAPSASYKPVQSIFLPKPSPSNSPIQSTSQPKPSQTTPPSAVTQQPSQPQVPADGMFTSLKLPKQNTTAYNPFHPYSKSNTSITSSTSSATQSPIASTTLSPITSTTLSPITSTTQSPITSATQSPITSATQSPTYLLPSSMPLYNQTSYLQSLRQSLNTSTTNTNTSTSTSSACCWNCAKRLTVDPGSGEPCYPCPLCKVKKPIV